MNEQTFNITDKYVLKGPTLPDGRYYFVPPDVDEPNGRNLMPPRRNDYIVDDGYCGSTYEMGVDSMKIHDAVWGSCEIKDGPYDKLLLELADTPLFQRLQAVEQLTFSGEFSTVPNTSRMSRWSHVWGSLVFVRKMSEGDDRFSDKDRIIMQLRTLFSDVGQTSFSHLGDWIFQGLKGGEDLHDQDLEALLKVSGIEQVLNSYDIDLEEVVFPDVKDWVECPSPALCVDRVDYGLREMLRWASPPLPLMLYANQLKNPQELFEVTDDGQLAIKDRKFARYFAAGFSLLASDNWSHPTHRVVMELMQTSIRDSLIDKTEYTGAHPRDLMYGIDSDFDTYFCKWGGAAVGDIMKQIALEQRKIFTVARKFDIERVFAGISNDSWEFPEFPDPLKPRTWMSEEFGDYPLPTQLTVKEADVDEPYVTATKRGLQIGLPSLKSRSVDPLVKTQGGYKVLSDLEPSYGEYMDDHNRLMQRGFKATIHMRTDIAEKLANKYRQTNEEWGQIEKRKRSDEILKRAIGATSFSLMATGAKFDHFEETTEYRKRLEPQRVRGIEAFTEHILDFQ